MIRYDTAPEAAEAELRRISHEIDGLEGEIAVLDEQIEQVQAEEWATPEEEAEISRRVNEMDAKIDDLQNDLKSAEEHHSNTHDYWFEEIEDDDA